MSCPPCKMLEALAALTDVQRETFTKEEAYCAGFALARALEKLDIEVTLKEFDGRVPADHHSFSQEVVDHMCDMHRMKIAMYTAAGEALIEPTIRKMREELHNHKIRKR